MAEAITKEISVENSKRVFGSIPNGYVWKICLEIFQENFWRSLPLNNRRNSLTIFRWDSSKIAEFLEEFVKDFLDKFLRKFLHFVGFHSEIRLGFFSVLSSVFFFFMPSRWWSKNPQKQKIDKFTVAIATHVLNIS